ncbi:hypothetical protein BGX28_007280 [Mortierella sp. GBA30]|nr:hypothetical protein BGX28_007280 [Mortierella sp. GBA30]
MPQQPDVTASDQQCSVEKISHEDVHLILAPGTTIIEHTWTCNHRAFGGTIELNTYLAGLKHLDRQEFSGRKNHKIWILVPKIFNVEDVEDRLDLDQVLASVETYERPGLMASKGEGVKDVRSISIACVHTPERHRGNGYASFMMRLLWKEIQQMSHVSFTFLYSAVGPTFYGRFGWAPKRSDEMLVPTDHRLPHAESDTIDPLVLQEVTDQELPALLERDATLLRQSMLEQVLALSLTNSNKILIAPLPEPNCIRWFIARAMFTIKHVLKLDQPQITAIGVKDPKGDSFLLWYPGLTEDKLYILRWRLDANLSKDESDKTARAMIKAAQQEALKWNLSKVVIWNPKESLADMLGLSIRYRYEKAIPSMGLVTSAEHDPADVEWVLSEKYSW